MSEFKAPGGPYFHVSGLNMEICGINLRINYGNGKIQTRKNSVFIDFLIKKTHKKYYLCKQHSLKKEND